MMVKDRKEMFFYMLEIAGRTISPTLQEKEYDEITSDDAN